MSIELKSGPIVPIADASQDPAWQPAPPATEMEKAAAALARRAENEDRRMFNGKIVALQGHTRQDQIDAFNAHLDGKPPPLRYFKGFKE